MGTSPRGAVRTLPALPGVDSPQPKCSRCMFKKQFCICNQIGEAPIATYDHIHMHIHMISLKTPPKLRTAAWNAALKRANSPSADVTPTAYYYYYDYYYYYYYYYSYYYSYYSYYYYYY